MDTALFWELMDDGEMAEKSRQGASMTRHGAELQLYETSGVGLDFDGVRRVLNAFGKPNTVEQAQSIVDRFGMPGQDGVRVIPPGKYDEAHEWISGLREPPPEGDPPDLESASSLDDDPQAPPPGFDTYGSGLAERWKAYMADRATVAAPSGCGGSGLLMLNQQSVMHYVGELVKQWRSHNGRWSQVNADMKRFNRCHACAQTRPGELCRLCASAPGPGRYPPAPRPLAPPPHRGLIAAHNVGAGKTAIALGVALYARRAWPDCTVIIAAEDADARTLSSSLPGEYHRFPEFGIDKIPASDLEKTRHEMAVGPAMLPVTCYAFPPACPELQPLPDGSPSVMIWSLETTMKDSLVTKIDDDDSQQFQRDRYGVVKVDDQNRPLAQTRQAERSLKPHWTRAPCTRTSGQTCLHGARRIPDGPVVLLVDEGHNLAVREGTPTRLENYAIMREFLRSPASANVYRILLTATPGSTPREVTELASLVTPDTPEVAQILAELGSGSDDPALHHEFATVMRGCVDVWQTLGNSAVYPILRFADDRVPFQDKNTAAKHVRSTCTRAPSGYSHVEAASALRDDDGFRTYAAHVAALHTASATADTVAIDDVLMHAVTDARGAADDEDDAGQAGSIEMVVPASNEAVLKGPTLAQEAVRALASARTFAQFTHSFVRGSYKTRPERIKKKLRGDSPHAGVLGSSVSALREAAWRGEREPPPCALTDVAPRLAMLAMELLRPVQNPNEAERAIQEQTGRVMPACKQLVVVPLLPSQKNYFPQHLFVRDLLEIVCGLRPLKWDDRTGESAVEPGQLYYVSTQNKDVYKQLNSKGCGGCRVDENPDQCGRFNLRTNMYGQQVPVVLIHDAKRTTAYSLQAVQRIHLTDWCDPTVAAQAMGRSQRPFAAQKLPDDRRRVAVLTYSVCGSDGNGKADENVAGRRIATTINQALRNDATDAGEGRNKADADLSLASAVNRATSVLRDKSSADLERSAKLERAQQMAQTLAAQGPHSTMTNIEFQLLLFLAVDLCAAQWDGSSTVQLPEKVISAMRTLPSSLRDALPWRDGRGAVEKQWPSVDRMKLPPRLAPLAADIARVAGNQAENARRTGYLAQSIASALAVVKAWDRDSTKRAPVGLDEALARAHAIPYAPVLQLYRGLMAASVSCALYAQIHRRIGQLPGIPTECGIPQEVACAGSADTGRVCEKDEDATQSTVDLSDTVAKLLQSMEQLDEPDLPDLHDASVAYGDALRAGDEERATRMRQEVQTLQAQRRDVVNDAVERQRDAAERVARYVGEMIEAATTLACESGDASGGCASVRQTGQTLRNQ